jgi:hypothetical protein
VLLMLMFQLCVVDVDVPALLLLMILLFQVRVIDVDVPASC